jgi:hypothetical protein
VQDPWTAVAEVNFRIALVMILLLAYLPAAFADGVQSARRTVAELAPHLRASPGRVAEIAAGAGRFDPVALRRAGWVGIAFALAIPVWTDRELGAWVIWRHETEAIAQRAMLPFIGWFAGRFLYSVAAESRRLSRIGDSLVDVDLLDQRRFAPLTRQGLRYALLAVGAVSILALYLYDFDKQGMLSVVASAGGIALFGAAGALLLPLRGARRAIQRAKRAELDWCNAELRRLRASAAHGPPPAGLADLVAWRTLVEGVPEWPLDAPAMRRFVLYLAIPIGSWLGGAMVERFVDVVLS